MKEVPTVYPTLSELENPIEYFSQTRITRLGNKFGIIKVVPPKEWSYVKCFRNNKVFFKPRLQQLNFLHILNRARWLFIKQLNNFYISNEIDIKLVEPVYKLENDHAWYFYDFYIELLKFINNFGSEEKLSPSNLKLINIKQLLNDKPLWRYLFKKFSIDKKFNILHWFNKYLKNYYIYIYNSNPNHCINSTNESYPFSILNDQIDDENSNDSSTDNETDICPICQLDFESCKDLTMCQSCNKHFHKDCITTYHSSKHKRIKLDNDTKITKPFICKNCIVGNGYYGFNNESINYSIDQFKKLTNQPTTSNTTEQLEDQFWSIINDPMNHKVVKYGTDIPYPLNHTDMGNNLQLVNLNSNSLLNICNNNISGMNVPWLYIGSKFSTFCWHMEDQYTFSANYQIEGNQKIWYCIPPRQYSNFQKMLCHLTPDLFIKQPDLMHQLISLVSPYDTQLFKKFKIDCFKAIQNPNEFIITFPQCYHSGFNTGYNLNEAVNFITTDWLTFGMKAINDYQQCGKKCVFDIYRMFLKILIENLKLSKGFINKNDINLCRESYQYLLIYYNLQVKNLKYINQSIMISQIELNSTTEEEIYCSDCQTICTMCFIVNTGIKPSDINTLQQSIINNQINAYCTCCFRKKLTSSSTIVLTFSLEKLKSILSLIDLKLANK